MNQDAKINYRTSAVLIKAALNVCFSEHSEPRNQGIVVSFDCTGFFSQKLC